MATVLNSPCPQFVFVFAAVRRNERQQRIHMLRTVAADERTARLPLARDYVLSLVACRSGRCAHDSRHHFPRRPVTP